MPPTPSLTTYPKITKQPFILVTTGGGGDGDDLIDWVISAYEADPKLEQPALILFGPFIDGTSAVRGAHRQGSRNST